MPWARQLDAVNTYKKDGRSVNVIGVSRCAKNIGNAKLQSLWYTMDAGSDDTTSIVLEDREGNWDTLGDKVKQYLNNYIPPHQLISVTFYEDCHPCDNGHIMSLVTHKAGKAPIKLNESAARNVTAADTIYSMAIFRDETTGAAAKQALTHVNRRGGQEGHVVSTANDSNTN